MPHQRSRHILNLILKRLKLWPVLAVLGPRQVGKSTLLRDQLAQKTDADYVTCHRDLLLIKGAKLSGELAEEILRCLAQSEQPTLATVAHYLKQNARRIRTHIEALEALFVLNKLNPHRLGVGKSHYYLCDSGLAKQLGANETIQFKTWILGECLSQHESAGVKIKTYFYSSSHRSIIDLIIENKNHLQAYIFSDEEAPGTYVFRTAEAFLKNAPQAKVSIFAPVNQVFHESKQINIIPWTGMV